MSRTAYLGSMGSFSSLAAVEMSGNDAEFVGLKNFGEVLESVSDGECDTAVLPVENTIAGSVSDSLDVLHRYPLLITAEHYLPVEQNLLVVDETVCIDQIAEVRSHQKALEQCTSFLLREMSPDIQLVADSDTVQSAIEVKQQANPSVAAIASGLAADVHGLHVVRSGIQDVTENYTRFVRVEPEGEYVRDEQADKCSLVLDIPHRKGSLLTIFQVLCDFEHNVMTASTRPIPDRLWEYFFFIDFVSEGGEENIDLAISALRSYTNECHVLGIYPNKSPMSWLDEN